MLSPDPYYPEDDFDVDYGLDLDQFEYNRSQLPRNQEPHHRFEHEPYDAYGSRGEYYGEGYYDHEPPYIMEYGDNIVMKARPEFEEIPGRPFEPREYYGEDKYDDIDRRPIGHSQPRYYHEPRMQEDPYYSSREHDTYSSRDRHDTYSSRDRHDPHRRTQRDFYSTAQYRKPSSTFEEDDHHSSVSHRSRPRDASPTKPSGSTRRSRSSNKKEKVRKFPPPDSKLPAIPPPDYDGADVGVKYVPEPDY